MTGEAAHLCTESWHVTEEIEDTNKWRHSQCSWIGRLAEMKKFVLPKAIYRVGVNAVHTVRHFLTNRTHNPELCEEPRNTRHGQSGLEENKAGSVVLLHL